ncbi:MAG: sensor histidine kinase [Bacillota bacterium]
MEAIQNRASRRLDAIFCTGYPHAINIFAALMLAFLPPLSILSGESAEGRSGWALALAVGLSLAYLLAWSRLRPKDQRWARGIYHELYLLGQTGVVAAIYALEGGLTRFLFVVIAVQAVYLIPVRRWAPFVGTVAVLWLTLFLAITPPGESGASMVAVIGMYLLYLIFAAMVTFTTLQQERQSQLAQKLLEGVDQRHQALKAYDLTVEQRSESEERERLAQTIHAQLVRRLENVSKRLLAFLADREKVTRESVRELRLDAKAVLSEVREAVRALRPGADGPELVEEDEPGHFEVPPKPDLTLKVTDPINVYHIWNLGVIITTAGVMTASQVVEGSDRWPQLLLLTLGLLAAYGGSALARSLHALKAFFVVLQAALIFVMVWQTREPLMNHLFLVISAQMIFLVPGGMKGVVASAVAFPTILTGAALWLPGDEFMGHAFPFSLTAAFGVTYFFAAVMAYMTLRQLEAREQALLYAQQLNEVNRLLEARLQEARQVAIARERVRMAREIHDGMGHHLTTVIVELQYAEALADEDREGALAHIESALGIVGAAMKASQEMVQTLERFDRPLPEALRDLVSGWMRATGTPVFLRIDGNASSLSTAARMTLFRAVQESLTNIQKHARPTRVEIHLAQLSDRVSLKVINDDLGGGGQVEAVRSGFGLVGLRERTEALMGEFSAEPRREGGFQVSLVLPMGV